MPSRPPVQSRHSARNFASHADPLTGRGLIACTRRMKLDLTLVTDGLQFPEGPVAMADGSIIVVEMKRGTLTRVRSNGTRDIIAPLGQGPNGAAIGPDGAAYVCNNGGAWGWQPGDLHLPGDPPEHYAGGSIQRVDLETGQFATLYDACDGKPLNSPNDIVFDSQGGFWFTCLGQSDGEIRRLGAVYYARIDGKRIVRWRSGLYSPNGIGLSPDERVLYMADCMKGQLLAFDLSAPGTMRPAETSPAGAWWRRSRDSSGSTASPSKRAAECAWPPSGTAVSRSSIRTEATSTIRCLMPSPRISASAVPTCATHRSPARAPAGSTAAAGRGRD